MSRLALAAGVAALSLTFLNVGPASAGPTVLTGSANSLGQAGSDTTYWMMQLIAPQYNVLSPQHDYVTEIPPVNTAPFPAATTVPADDVAAAKTWDSLSVGTTPPDGSSAGIAALNADTTGDIDFTRSSRGAKTGETSTLEFWAYALGAVDYVTFPGTNAPSGGISQANLIKIYTCNASGPNVGKPIISNWHQLNSNAPASSPIVRYAPQAGSGTLSFFESKLLGGNAVDTNCDSTHKAVRLQEHDARGVATATKKNAIYCFDWARWRAQSAGVEANLRNGSVLGKFGVASPFKSPTLDTVNTSSSRFYGTRYVYNVVRKDNHPVSFSGQHDDALRLIGVKTGVGGIGFLCQGAFAKTITLAGFKPLPKAATGGTGLPQSSCRLNPTDL